MSLVFYCPILFVGIHKRVSVDLFCWTRPWDLWKANKCPVLYFLSGSSKQRNTEATHLLELACKEYLKYVKNKKTTSLFAVVLFDLSCSICEANFSHIEKLLGTVGFAEDKRNFLLFFGVLPPAVMDEEIRGFLFINSLYQLTYQ